VVILGVTVKVVILTVWMFDDFLSSKNLTSENFDDFLLRRLLENNMYKIGEDIFDE
jgi:hypothetical protein